MTELWRETRKHVRIFGAFMRNYLASQMEYRANFVTGLFMEVGYLLVKLMYIVVVFQAGVDINGLTPDEILLFVGTFVFMTGIYAGLVMMNLYDLRALIRDGSLDFLIVKPVSLQFMITLRRSDLGLLLVDAGAGIVMIVIALIRMGGAFDPWRIIGFTVLMASCSVVAYAVFVIPVLASFWFVGANVASAVDPFWDFNNMPMGIYGKAIQNIGVYLIPIFVISNFPALFLLDRMTPVMMAWGFVVPFVMLALTRVVFQRAVRQYNSASS